jgi:Glycosyl hydrolase family 12
MAAHTKSRKRMPLAIVLCLLLAVVGGGYALASNRTPEKGNLTSASGASDKTVKVYACLAAGELTRVSVAAAPKCSAESARVRWAAQSGPASSLSPRHRASSTSRPSPSSPPSQAPTTTSSGPVRTQTSTTPAWLAWCSSASFGEWATPDGRFDLYNNEWNSSDNPGPQTICGNSASDWQVTSTQRAGNTAVLTYPSVQLNYNGTNGYPLSKFTSMTSSYAETMNELSGTDAEAAYDIWLNGLKKEIMVWVDNHGQAPAGSKVATTTFNGATWDLYETGDRSYMAFVRQGNASSDTVDLLAALKYLEGRGDLTASDVLWQVNFGWEICSTAGTAETFTVRNYSLTSAPSGAWFLGL